MKEKLIKYTKFIISVALILSLIAPSYASLSASDGSAFVTKAEFDSALSDFNSRLTTFEAGINSKIDSQVTSYLDRNGIWNGKTQVGYKNGICIDWMGAMASLPQWSIKTFSYYYGSSSSTDVSCLSTDLKNFNVSKNFIPEINKSGMLYINMTWAAVAQGVSENATTFWSLFTGDSSPTNFYAAAVWWAKDTNYGTTKPTRHLTDVPDSCAQANDGLNVWTWANSAGAPGNGAFKMDLEFQILGRVISSYNLFSTPACNMRQYAKNNGWENVGTSFGCQPATTITSFFFVSAHDKVDVNLHFYSTGRAYQNWLLCNGSGAKVQADGSLDSDKRPHGFIVIEQNELLVY